MRTALTGALPALLIVSASPLPAMAQDSAIVSAAFKSVFYLPVYVAEERGFFDEAGLDVRIDVASSSTNALAAVISRSADFSLHGPEWTAISAARGGEVQVIGGTLNRLGAWIACTNEVTYEGLDDLKGLRIVSGTMPTTSTSAFLNLIGKAGLDPSSDITLIEVPLGNEIGPLAAGQADCAVLYEPNASQAIDEGYKVVASFAEELGPYTFSAVSTRKDIDPAIAEKFLTGINKALVFIHENPDEAVASGLSLFPNLKPAVVEGSVRRLISDEVFAKSIAIPDEALTAALQTQVDLGNLSEIPPADTFLNLQWANEVVAQ
ncbi:ABC transporter substrate-binding protein [Aureimonas altamirensis]|uniref:ABC transporter substrate-binding protein n=1 Tax=Aureimonas altamirensis TaxID=370622 RepID=UPI003018AEAA